MDGNGNAGGGASGGAGATDSQVVQGMSVQEHLAAVPPPVSSPPLSPHIPPLSTPSAASGGASSSPDSGAGAGATAGVDAGVRAKHGSNRAGGGGQGAAEGCGVGCGSEPNETPSPAEFSQLRENGPASERVKGGMKPAPDVVSSSERSNERPRPGDRPRKGLSSAPSTSATVESDGSSSSNLEGGTREAPVIRPAADSVDAAAKPTVKASRMRSPVTDDAVQC